MRVAIIGGGAAGMGCAKTLIDAEIDVTLFEELPRLGGHCFAVPVPEGKRTLLVDAGVSDFNRATSHEVRHARRARRDRRRPPAVLASRRSPR